jgi:hypothetical protein
MAEDEQTAFPASETVPGQPESRSARARFLESKQDCPWFEEYEILRAEGWTWRLAAYIAWASSPVQGRWPRNLEELATQVLGMRSERSIRNWRKKRPEIDERVGRLQVEPLFRHRADVISALVEVASMPDPKAHQDRKLFLEMTGDYKPKGNVSLTGPDGDPLIIRIVDEEEPEDDA